MAAGTIHQLVDTSTFDADGRPGLTYRQIYGIRVAAEWCLRAVLTPRGSLPWNRNRGVNLLDYVNADLGQSQLTALRTSCDREIQLVDFVVTVVSTLRIVADVLEYRPFVTFDGDTTRPLAVKASEAFGAIIDLGAI